MPVAIHHVLPADCAYQLAPGVIDIWQIPFEIMDRQAEPLRQAYGRLSLSERQRADRFKVDSAYCEYVLSHAYLRQVLSGYLGCAEEDIDFRCNEAGKPYLSEAWCQRRAIQFNLSHTHGMSVLAVSGQQEIGVDVEFRRNNIDVLSLAARYFTEMEYQHLKNLSDERQLNAFYQYWTLKEAFIKTLGGGLAQCPLDQFSVRIDQTQQNCLYTVSDVLQRKFYTDRIYLQLLAMQENYPIALGVNGSISHINIFVVESLELHQ